MTQPHQPSILGGDEQYLPSLSVPGAEGFYGQWASNSTHARGRHEPRELAYGDGVNERMDVFEPKNPRGTVLFIHGGYWSELSRRDFSYVAPELVKDKWRVAVVDHDLAPDATLTHIVDQLRRAVVALAGQYAEPLVVSGHSAGGHLAAMLHATDWSAYGVEPGIVAGIGISGLYELEPLTATSVQTDVQLTADEVAALSPARLAPTAAAPFHLVVGSLESAAFHGQADLLHERWPGVAQAPRELPGHNHFTVCDELARLVADATRAV